MAKLRGQMLSVETGSDVVEVLALLAMTWLAEATALRTISAPTQILASGDQPVDWSSPGCN